MSGNLEGWKLKVIKKDAKGNYTIFNRYTVSASLAALILSVGLAVGQWYNTFHGGKLPIPKGDAPVQVEESTNLTSTFKSSDNITISSNYSDLVTPTQVDEYKLVKIRSDEEADFYDLLVMTIFNNDVLFVDTVQTSVPGEWVFTGRPGKYSIRLTSFDADTGFKAVTGNVTIGKVNPTPPGPGPTPPGPTPPGPNPPPPNNVPNGAYGFGPVLYAELVKIPANHIKYAESLKGNFESVAAAAVATNSLPTPNDMNRELQGKNRLTFASDPEALAAWTPFFQAWSNRSNQLNKEGKLPNVKTEYAAVYRETAEVLELFVK